MSFVCLSVPPRPAILPTGAEPGGATPLAPVAGGGDKRHPAAADRTPETIAPALLALSPHIAIEEREHTRLVWLDARGLSSRALADRAIAVMQAHGAPPDAVVRAGIADSAIAAEAAATLAASNDRVHVVPTGSDRHFLAAFPLPALRRLSGSALHTPPFLRTLSTMTRVGIERCGDLTRLTLEAVEVRFGAEGVALWHLARGEDRRPAIVLFPPRRPPLPSASFAWDEYALRDAQRLLFVANQLLTTVCDTLQQNGAGARVMTLTFALAGRGTLTSTLRSARTTAVRATWVRLIRAELERVSLPDAVIGLALEVGAAGEREGPQGDLFDRGFQSASATEEAVARLVDDRLGVVVAPAVTSHPLAERRVTWQAVAPQSVLRGIVGGIERDTPTPTPPPPAAPSPAPVPRTVVPHLSIISPPGQTSERSPPDSPAPTLTLQLLPAPLRLSVTTRRRRGVRIPVRYHLSSDRMPERLLAAAPAAIHPPREDVMLLSASGPDRVAGSVVDDEGAPYAREYFHCLTASGVLVLLFRDVAGSAGERSPRRGEWYLHGWWD